MEKITKYVLIIVFVVGLSTFSFHSRSLKAAKKNESPQFRIIGLDCKVYTIRNHEYVGKDNLGLVHMADCKTCEIEELNKQKHLEDLVDKAVSDLGDLVDKAVLQLIEGLQTSDKD